MSSSHGHRSYTPHSKSRPSTPASADYHSGTFFRPNHSGRPVLPPPVPSANLNPSDMEVYSMYNQPRSYQFGSGFPDPWNDPSPSLSHYEYQSYSPHEAYTMYSGRPEPSYGQPVPPKRLPPLQMSTSGYSPHERSLRSPTNFYPDTYYSGHGQPEPNYSGAPISPTHVHHARHGSGPSARYSPPISPSSSEEPTIKKKRKRADAHQLKVLNDTYSRTAFPTTDERLALAQQLDMSARSVQIWFQNKRQSMKQTNRHSDSRPHTAAGSIPSIPNQLSPVPKPGLTSQHRRIRSQEEVEGGRKPSTRRGI